MTITIYQINLERDTEAVAFESAERMEMLRHSPEIPSEIYDRVYCGSVEADDLEDVYRIFNLEQPEDYRGRALSVSDIVETADPETGAVSWHYCDLIGFKDVAFDPDKTSELKEKKMRVVYVEPGKPSRTAEIGTGLEELQAAVGGCIETFYPFEEEVCIVCNEEAKINGMKLNRGIFGKDGELVDIIAGPFFICDCSGENFASLTPEQLERYGKMFSRPERFYKRDGTIVSVPYENREKEKEK